MRQNTPFVLLFAAVASCSSSPPQPPIPDESTRRPVNSAGAIELQSCQSNLANTRLLVEESSRNGERAAGAMVPLAEQCQLAPVSEESKTASTVPNTVYVVLFEYAKYRIRLSDEETDRLIRDAKTATSIHVRGRTDASRDNAFDSMLAARRADAALTLLVNHGVDPSRIRATYQGQGDAMVSNADEKIRALNRRAEIEIYRTPAEVVLLGSREQS